MTLNQNQRNQHHDDIEGNEDHVHDHEHIHPKSEQIGGVCLMVPKKWRKKCVYRNKKFTTKVRKSQQNCQKLSILSKFSKNVRSQPKFSRSQPKFWWKMSRDASFLDECMNMMHFVSNTTMALKAMKTMYTTMNTIHFVLHLYAPEEEAIASKACANKFIS